MDSGIYTSLVFLTAGLFMGWSLGANDTANVFGTAVGTRMVKFRTAAFIASLFVILGATLSGTGATNSLGELGKINAIAGAFTVSASAAFTVTFMIRKGLSVSTSQAIVGAIIGWNMFSKNKTNPEVIYKIAGTWVFAPVLSAIFAIILYFLIKLLLTHVKIHVVNLDRYTRYALILVGAFGAYSLGANNIYNVMGVYVNVIPFKDVQITDSISISSTMLLFLLGGIAVAVGIWTYSGKVMKTVGTGIVKLSPISAFITVLASSLVLFFFSNKSLHHFLTSRNLPAFPLVPVSQSQAIVGAILGIGIAKGNRNVNYRQILKIAIGWVVTPVMSSIISYIGLAIMQNVFMFEVFK
jgi:PiT family inorganic phosphate transporter